MDQQMEELVAKLRELLPNFTTYSDDPVALQEAIGSELEGVDRESYTQALDQVMQDYGVPEEGREYAADQLEAQDDYSPEGLLQHLNVVINAPQVTNHIDQSLDIHGEVHGDVYQANESNVANAMGEGAIAGEEVYGNQVQTGDGQQVGGDSGVQNQGNNSGQQAGYDAVADNVTTGDGNTVGSDWASRVGAEQVSQDGAYINDSAQAFGEGSATNEANDTYDSHDTYTETDSVADSYNYDSTDTDTITQTIDVDSHEGYEPGHGHDDYKPDYKPEFEHGHDHGGDHFHQEAEIVE